MGPSRVQCSGAACEAGQERHPGAPGDELGFTDSHPSQTHHHGKVEKIAKVIAINTLHTKMLAY
jgi:hypothetical protein